MVTDRPDVVAPVVDYLPDLPREQAIPVAEQVARRILSRVNHVSTPSNPFREMERMFRRMSEQIQEASQQYGSGTSTEDVPIDLLDAGDEYVLTADLPGFEKDDVDLRIVGTRLRVRADRETETSEENESYVHRERHHRTLQRTIDLPGEVEATEISAKFTNGVLTVRIPKAEPMAEGEEIAIED